MPIHSGASGTTTAIPKPLRERAEDFLRASRSDVDLMPTEDVQRLVHELQVHQIELEMQNEELRQAQMDLSKSRDRYSDLYEFAPVGYLSLNRDGVILEANLTAARMLGIERKDLYGAKFSSFVSDRSQDVYYLHRKGVFFTEGKQVCELEMQPAVGPALTLRLESIACDATRASSRECRTALIDVSQRRVAEDALRQLNATLEQRVAEQTQQVKRFAEIVSSSNDAIISKNLDGTIDSWNDAAQRLFGYSRDEILGRSIMLLVPPDRVDEEAWILDGIRRGRGIERFETVRLTKDARRIDVSLTISPLDDASGRIVGASDISRDISGDVRRRLRIEHLLTETDERLRAVLDAVSDAIITIDQSGIVTSVNPATERMFGYPPDELVGQNVSRLMPSPYAEEHDGYIARYLKTGEARILGSGRELTGLRKDGSTFPMDLAVSRVDHLDVFTGVIRDISERKALQRHVLEIAAEEQRRIGRELHDGTFQELTALSLIAATLRDGLKSLVQNDSPVRIAGQFAEPLLERLCATATSLCQNLVESGRHVRDLSHGIMPVQIDNEGLRSALEELADSTAELPGISCTFECAEPVSLSNNTTATHLYRIAQEAVNNALRHGRANHIRISIVLEDGRLVLEVSDNGSGIVLPAAGQGRSRGLGLQTMRYRAGIIGGIFQAERSAEGGTLVRCTIPREESRRE